MADIREVFVDTKGVIRVLYERDYSNWRNTEDLYNVQNKESVTNNYCSKRNGKTVQYIIIHNFMSKNLFKASFDCIVCPGRFCPGLMTSVGDLRHHLQSDVHQAIVLFKANR